MFASITHVIPCPAGHQPGWNFTLVGAVPAVLLDGPQGRSRPWPSVQSILDEATKYPGQVQLCALAGCACRKLFTLHPYSVITYTKSQTWAVLHSLAAHLPNGFIVPSEMNRLPRQGVTLNFPTAWGGLRLRRDEQSTARKPLWTIQQFRWETVAPAAQPSWTKVPA